MTRRGRNAALALTAALCACAAPGPEIRVDGGRVEVHGLSAARLATLRRAHGGEWSRVLKVAVADAPDGAPVMAGRYAVDGAVLRFVPAFALAPGVGYVASFAPGDAPARRLRFALPRPDPGPRVRITGIYPSGPELPENVLRFYVHFSAPVRQGDVYRHVALLDGDGRPIDLPFLEIDEELWNPDGTRLTLLVDPGRVKHELRPRQEAGPVFVAGERRTLVVRGSWPDAHGRPLAQGFEKAYRIGAADARQPRPAEWQFRPPRAGTRGVLDVAFAEPLDHALLQRMIEVTTGAGERVAGRIEVGPGERSVRFHPDAPWRAGAFALRVDTELEDPSGNSVRAPFEVDVHGVAARRLEKTEVVVPLEIR